MSAQRDHFGTMGDRVEIQITPETPGRPSVLNPFESPNDYHRLHESLVPSPSVFKCAKASSATPGKFKWSIDEMSSLLPVHIDPEDIHRQALYLSQARTDSAIEEKRQNAIEQFFTKGPIVPSPWGHPTCKQTMQLQSSLSPLETEEPQSAKKVSATCQTILSLPVDFDLEKVLGDYYREEFSEQVQETLSSSSLRRKLFLDGHGSGSESSSPSSPDRDEAHGGNEDLMSSVILSPMRCKLAATTPSSGQFSSSPIQGQRRAYSLGSANSPMFPERSSPVFKSPTLSPIVLQHSVSPLSGERKQLSFVSPNCRTSDYVASSRCGESPFVEGCSPIRICSPLHPNPKPRTTRATSRTAAWASPPHISPILHLESVQQDKDNIHPSPTVPKMDLDACSPLPRCQTPAPERMEEGDENENVAAQRLESSEEQEAEEVTGGEEFCHWAPKREQVEEEEEDAPSLMRLTSSRMGSASNVESTRMFVSLLAEGSATPYDVSMQVDSGYNTHSACATSLMDAVSSDSQSKELLQDTHAAEEGLGYAKYTKAKPLMPHY